MDNSSLLKVYCGILRPDIRYLELLNPNFGFRKRKNIFGDKDIFDDFVNPILEIVDDLYIADYILIPHDYSLIQNNKEYIEDFISLSRKFSKRIIIFFVGDSDAYVDIPDSIVFRMSQYSSKKLKNEIIMPAYATDLSYGKDIVYNEKRDIPTVGFCGWAGLKGIINQSSFLLKNYILLSDHFRQGLYFRKKTINILSKSSLVRSNFIIRKSYSANKNTIELDAKRAREEYRNNIIESDFILAPKGDGNYSVRFYEALSLGRIPILIDTDCILPLVKDIDYSKFILKVSYRDIGKMDTIISDFYNKLSNEEWIEMQKKAREIFDRYLRIDVFFRHIMTKDNLARYIL